MYPYLLIYSISSFVAFLARPRSANRLLAGIFLFALLIFVGGRGPVGCDYGAYLLRFNSLLHGGVEALATQQRGELGFLGLNLLIQHLGLPFDALIFVCGAISIFCLWRFSRLVQRPLTVVTLSFPVLIVQLSMSGLRQALAVAFMMLAFSSFVRKRAAWVAIWILVAAQFHTSALIFFPLVFLVGRHISLRKLVMAFALLSPFVLYLMQERIAVYSDRYVQEIYGEMSASGAWIRYILIIAPLAYAYFKLDRIKAYYPNLQELFRIFFYVAVFMAFLGAVSSVVLHRMIYYVMPVSILALVCISDHAFSPRHRALSAALPYLFYGAYIFGWFGMSRHAAECFAPYTSWIL